MKLNEQKSTCDNTMINRLKISCPECIKINSAQYMCGDDVTDDTKKLMKMCDHKKSCTYDAKMIRDMMNEDNCDGDNMLTLKVQAM